VAEAWGRNEKGNVSPWESSRSNQETRDSFKACDRAAAGSKEIDHDGGKDKNGKRLVWLFSLVCLSAASELERRVGRDEMKPPEMLPSFRYGAKAE
jgi:hypothetical protein